MIFDETMAPKSGVLIGLGICVGAIIGELFFMPDFVFFSLSVAGSAAIAALLARHMHQRQLNRIKLSRRLDEMSEGLTQTGRSRPIVPHDDPATSSIYCTPPPLAKPAQKRRQ